MVGSRSSGPAVRGQHLARMSLGLLARHRQRLALIAEQLEQQVGCILRRGRGPPTQGSRSAIELAGRRLQLDDEGAGRRRADAQRAGGSCGDVAAGEPLPPREDR